MPAVTHPPSVPEGVDILSLHLVCGGDRFNCSRSVPVVHRQLSISRFSAIRVLETGAFLWWTALLSSTWKLFAQGVNLLNALFFAKVCQETAWSQDKR